MNLSPTLVRRIAPHAGEVTWRLLALVAALEIVYLLGANAILKTSLLRDFAAKSDDIRIEYDRAYSVLPGRIMVENLAVRVEDHNIQFQVEVERGLLDVSLHELFVKRFHALRVDGERVSYRMRHKLSKVGKEGPRVAAYPPIPGFSDPPLYDPGPPPGPISDAEYNLWEVVIDKVTAHVKEIWVLEYRYLGEGTARGSFRVRPARNYEVSGTTLDLYGGALTLGKVSVAERVSVAIDCRVSFSETQKLHGLEPLRHVSAGVRGRFDGTDLTFLNAYLGPRTDLASAGRATVNLGLRVKDGSVSPESRLSVESPNASLDAGSFRLTGQASAELEGPRKEGEPLTLRFRFRELALDLAREKRRSPVVESAEVRLQATSDLARPIELESAELAPTRVDVPDLGVVTKAFGTGPDRPELGGRASLLLDARREGPERVRGSAKITFSGSTLALGDRRSLPWDATVSSQDLRANVGGTPRLEGTLSLHLDRASSLLPLVSPSPFLQRIENAVLDLEELVARVAFRVGKEARVDLMEAKTGIVTMRGHLFKVPGGASGAFLFSTPAANVGFRVRPAGTEVKPFVDDDWLAQSGSVTRGVLPRSERGRLPRTARGTR